MYQSKYCLTSLCIKSEHKSETLHSVVSLVMTYISPILVTLWAWLMDVASATFSLICCHGETDEFADRFWILEAENFKRFPPVSSGLICANWRIISTPGKICLPFCSLHLLRLQQCFPVFPKGIHEDCPTHPTPLYPSGSICRTAWERGGTKHFLQPNCMGRYHIKHFLFPLPCDYYFPFLGRCRLHLSSAFAVSSCCTSLQSMCLINFYSN